MRSVSKEYLFYETQNGSENSKLLRELLHEKMVEKGAISVDKNTYACARIPLQDYIAQNPDLQGLSPFQLPDTVSKAGTLKQKVTAILDLLSARTKIKNPEINDQYPNYAIAEDSQRSYGFSIPTIAYNKEQLARASDKSIAATLAHESAHLALNHNCDEKTEKAMQRTNSSSMVLTTIITLFSMNTQDKLMKKLSISNGLLRNGLKGVLWGSYFIACAGMAKAISEAVFHGSKKCQELEYEADILGAYFLGDQQPIIENYRKFSQENIGVIGGQPWIDKVARFILPVTHPSWQNRINMLEKLDLTQPPPLLSNK